MVHWLQDQFLPHGDFMDRHLFAIDPLSANLIIHTKQDRLDVCTPGDKKINKSFLKSFDSTSSSDFVRYRFQYILLSFIVFSTLYTQMFIMNIKLLHGIFVTNLQWTMFL